jgi:putative DNA primase/helicase
MMSAFRKKETRGGGQDMSEWSYHAPAGNAGFSLWGGVLSAADLEALAARWIDREAAERQLLRRVNSLEGAEVVGKRTGSFAGLLIPNVWPGSNHIREYRLRRDHPEVENGKPKMKYVAPPGRGNLLYFPVGTDPAWLSDPELPLVITEGEFKAIALARAARHDWQKAEPRFLAVGLSGVWNWKGTVGKTIDSHGNRVDEKGPIADLQRIAWDDRPVLIVFDADLEDNDSVQAARYMLTKELRSRAARVSWFDWPADRPLQAKGIDDLPAALGPESVLRMIEDALARTAGPPCLIPFHFADSGNADRLVSMHGADLRYGFAFRKWMVWDGRRWTVDNTGQALKRAKLTMIDFLHQAIEAKHETAEKFARASLNAHRLQAALLLAQPELPIMPTELDRAPWLLNFSNGTVDLRTGTLCRHRRDDLISKMVAFPYRPEAACPTWHAFLAKITGVGPDASEGDLERSDELINYLQLALGYSITGEVGEKAVFVAYGTGDNGKTTLLSVVRDLIRDFAVTVGLDLLTARDDSNNVAAARAKLRGVRFVSSSETEEGQRLSAARLKRICQGPGGEIEACRKYENPITFPETHKLWIDANHRPELPATDAAVWNRVHLIPFSVTIPKAEQDRKLTARLLEEGEGILAWLVEGAKRWYAKGLPKLKVITDATNAWQKELDRLSVYLDEYTEKAADAEAYVPNKVLYEAYKSWCESNGERTLSHSRFTGQMEAMGHRKERKEAGNVWRGIRFKRKEAGNVCGNPVQAAVGL